MGCEVSVSAEEQSCLEGVYTVRRSEKWGGNQSQTSEGLIRKVPNRHGTENQSTKHTCYRKPKSQTRRRNRHFTENQSTKQIGYRKLKYQTDMLQKIKVPNRHVTENLSHKLVEEEGSAGLAYNYKETNNSTVSIMRQC